MSTAVMRVDELWRYPVKSMGGERLEEADLGPLGIPGDRVVHVINRRGRVVTSRSHPLLLTHHATLAPDGQPLVDGRIWSSPGVSRDVELAAGEGSHLVRYDGPERFDILPLLVATLEIRQEMYRGELREPRRATLPVAAALGGMLVPACIFAALNVGRASSNGWGSLRPLRG